MEYFNFTKQHMASQGRTAGKKTPAVDQVDNDGPQNSEHARCGHLKAHQMGLEKG